MPNQQKKMFVFDTRVLHNTLSFACFFPPASVGAAGSTSLHRSPITPEKIISPKFLCAIGENFLPYNTQMFCCFALAAEKAVG